MIVLDIPGYRPLRLEHLVLDYNGTLAVDGVPLPGVLDRLRELAGHLAVHVITADTFGKVEAALAGTPCRVSILPLENQDLAKRDYLERLGAERCVAVGNGRNDRLMLASAALGIAVLLAEGCAGGNLQAADILCGSILDALDLLTHPLRLTATLRA